MKSTTGSHLPLDMRARMMSKRQRIVFLHELLEIPRYMQRRLQNPETQDDVAFIVVWNQLVSGKMPVTGDNLNTLKALLESADKARYATSPALLSMPA